MSCRLAWHLGYREGWRPIASAVALEFGTAIHRALEEYYAGRGDLVDVFVSVWDARRDDLDPTEYRDHRDLGIAMLRGYRETYKNRDNFEVLATEHVLRRPLPAPSGRRTACILNARLDGLVRSYEDGNLYVLEHKTFQRFDPSWLELDHQLSAQVWLGQALADDLGLEGEHVVGVIWNGLRKQRPGPRVRSRLFERHVVSRTRRHIEVFLTRAYGQYRELIATRGREVLIYPQPAQVRCAMCDFREVCRVYQSGGDWEFILRTSYHRRKQYEQDERGGGNISGDTQNGG